MAMSEQQTRWGCPNCSEVFPSRDHLKKHLEPDRRLILNLWRQLQQAFRLPSCQQAPHGEECPTASDKENEVSLDFTVRPQADVSFRCPSCRAKQEYSRKDHLLRHYKMHVVCDVECECDQKFDRVDQFERHLQDCLVLHRDDKQKHMQMLGLKKHLNWVALEDLNQQLDRYQEHYPDSVNSQKYGRRGRGNETSIVMRKRSVEGEVDLSNTKRRRSGRKGYIMGNAISLKRDHNSTVERGPIRDSISNIENMPDLPTALYTARSQASIHPNTSTDDVSTAQNVVDANPPTMGGYKFGGPQVPETDGTECQSYYVAGVDWGDFNACDPRTSQSQLNSPGSMHNNEQYVFGMTSGDGTEEWSYLTNDWLLFNATRKGQVDNI